MLLLLGSAKAATSPAGAGQVLKDNKLFAKAQS
jgi:hypothetical protein